VLAGDAEVVEQRERRREAVHSREIDGVDREDAAAAVAARLDDLGHMRGHGFTS